MKMLEPSRPISLAIEAGRKAMMPIMMISEMPLPIPFSVIRSPSHIMNSVPLVRQITVVTMKAYCGMTMACAARRAEVDRVPDGLEQGDADGPVAGELRDLLPTVLAFRWSFWKYGTTAPISWMMMDAVMYGMMPRANTPARRRRHRRTGRTTRRGRPGYSSCPCGSEARRRRCPGGSRRTRAGTRRGRRA